MTLNIWRFTDGKPGHDSQSTGLCEAIADLSSVKIYDVATNSLIDCLKNFLSRKFPDGSKLPNPDIIVGAGHKTHLTMLLVKYVRKGKIIVVMKPSLPLFFFDICVIPKHDCPPKNNNVIKTTGSLNTIKFNKNKLENTGLILIGGPSKHYEWDDKLIMNQIDIILSNNKKVFWDILNSPRTPKNFLSKVLLSNKKNTNLLDFNERKNIDIKKLIFSSKYIWVSPDSVSMIYESLSSGASVGLFDIPKKRKTNINFSVDRLIAENHVTTFKIWKKTNSLKRNNLKLSEAARCASIIVDRLL